ncbi:cobalt-precorrin-7 (C(5))-methyltransferase [Limosilactobacillus reuteri]|uniref:cobalt-precorrin-7 (C(5))-methyltransferase n=1 Tax=Limosilactobacillus reuteri TaxID=1598 RepID=UPI000C1B6EC5|nr:cobalt-precorrin-7 (C(5))-methyltransferase [Limosilactobacillus reuteri]MCC4440739.1 cobalt-precorrin-7 (C(5))-methyltransferase [Limosilactobacillus reuteri]PIN30307.1 cobalt-precorrin-7 (C(5))-methyltransferase [Limosilactobacillus reuteri]PUH34417.1 cobalt-precorrin-7 (C(5))-methyltransferase [Limosilactobacillus reuteri]PUH34467.1 cobalt-precorrin-7 (C(5))-methyltransferase [Limosilactobacillus reuteri]WLC96780.1 cobalt-precorrin-7 (C(5))-methyltransferase [Limosilactobacillus reuteri]
MIVVLGIGPGNEDYRLEGMTKYLAEADVVIGSNRQLETISNIPENKKMILPHLVELRDYLREHYNDKNVLLASGDPLLYGIGTWVKSNIQNQKIKIIPGISSIQYMFHQLQLSMNNCYLTSSHGRTPDFDFLLQHSKVGMVTDQKIGPFEIGQEIKKRGLHKKIYVGERLSYPDERITCYDESTVEQRKYEMNVVVITNA